MRKVRFKKTQLVNNKTWELDKDFIHDAFFHQIVATSEEVLAVIEMPDGTIDTIEIERIKFTERPIPDKMTITVNPVLKSKEQK